MLILKTKKVYFIIRNIITYSLACLIVFSTSLNVVALQNNEQTSIENFAVCKVNQSKIIGFSSYGEGTYGGEGGEEVTVSTAADFRDAVSGNTPAIVYVEGTINLDDLFVGSPGVEVRVGSYKTIIGLGNDAKIIRGGLLIRDSTQVIIRNIQFLNALSYASGEEPDGNGWIISTPLRLNPGDFTQIDSINIRNSSYIWIDGNEFSDDPWIANDVLTGQNRHDGLLDIRSGSDFITVSHNIFTNHNKTSMIGHSDNNSAEDEGKLNITYFGNWFKGTVQRNPRVRFGQVHLLNNYFEDVRSYSIGVGAGAKIIAEGNYFENITRAWGFPDGTPNPMGYLLPINNILVNSSYDEVITSDGILWNPKEYYTYNALPAESVKGYVQSNAGIKGK